MNARQKQAISIVLALEAEYPQALCSLDYHKPYELLIATRLSAQCTDARVNIVTLELFSKFPTLQSFAAASAEDVEKIVRPCGLGATKARDIVRMTNVLLEKFGSVVPGTMEELLSLPGVGRKTANLIMGDVFKKPAIVCDTHCIRINGLLGLSGSKNPVVVERELLKLIPPEKSSDYCHRMVLHGRAVCKARKPECSSCCVADYCDYDISNKKGQNNE